MKQEIKKLGILFLLMILFNSSQEKECLSIKKCVATVPVAREKTAEVIDDASYDEMVPISPISRFILIRY